MVGSGFRKKQKASIQIPVTSREIQGSNKEADSDVWHRERSLTVTAPNAKLVDTTDNSAICWKIVLGEPCLLLPRTDANSCMWCWIL